MNLTINGEKKQFDRPLTVAGLLAKLGFESQMVAVERNLEIVHKTEMDKIELKDNDSLEIVRMVSGG